MKERYVELDDANFEDETREGFTLAFFWDPWEPGCRREWKIIEKAADVFGGRVKVGRCSVETCPHLPERCGVCSIPTAVLIRDGREKERLVGLRHRGALVRHLRRYV